MTVRPDPGCISVHPSPRFHGPHVVYILRDSGGVCLYVGCTSHLERRLATHARKKVWWLDVDASRTVLEEFPCGCLALEHERVETERLAPVHAVSARCAVRKPKHLWPMLGVIVRELRIGSELSRHQLTMMAQVSLSTILRLEAHGAVPQPLLLASIASALDTTSGALLLAAENREAA